jgi:hypothetical protein
VSGIPLATAESWSFGTGAGSDVVAPGVSGAVTPLNGAGPVVNTQPISITFNEPMSGTTAGAMTVTADGTAIPGGFVTSDSLTFTFTPTSGVLPSSSTIVVTAPVLGLVQDSSGNALAAFPAWSFTTEVPVSLTPSGSTAAVSVTAGGNLVSVGTLSAVAAESLAAGFGKTPPTGFTFDSGFIHYKVNSVAMGGSATVRIVFPVAVTGKTIYKFKQSTGDYVALSVGAGANQYQVVDATTIDLNVVDGGQLDDDGVADTVIIDPVGPATPIVLTTTTLTGDSGGGGGGCAFNPNARFDGSMILALLASLGFLGWKRKRQD